MALVNFGDVL